MTKKRRKILITTAAFLLTAAAFFAGCSPSGVELSPMPAVDMSKNTIITESSQPTSVETTFQAAPKIELMAPAEEFWDQGSNIENNGMAVEVDGTVYYISGGLNSMSQSGNHKKQLTQQNDMLYLNSYEEYIYYISSDDYVIYRLDTSAPESPEKLNISGAYSMMVIRDHIYYQNAIGENSDNYVYRADMDGTNPENLMIKSSAFCTDGQTIYFANAGDGNMLYSLDTCTGEIELLSNNQASQLNIIGGSLYYINKGTKHITKLDLETMESTILSEENFSYLNNNGELLVFYSAETGVLGTMAPDGTEVNQILEYNDVNALNVVGDWILFESFENIFGEKVFLIKTDGTGLSDELPVTSMAIITDYDPATKTVYCDFVSYLTGETALAEYMNDNSISERKAQEAMEEAGGIYIQNKNPNVLFYSLSDLTDITLHVSADSSHSPEGYKANIALFENLYAKDPKLITDELYVITAYEEQIIKIEQFFEP